MSENQTRDNEQKQPEAGAPKQSEDVISEYYDGVKKLEMQGYETGIRKARNALFVTAALFLIMELITVGRAGVEFSPILIVFLIVEVGTFVALGFWTKTKPYAAIIVGLIFFMILWIFAIVTVGTTAIYGGIIFRIIVLVVLISALKPAKAWEELKKNS